MIFAARNCMLLNKSSFTLDDVSQAPQQCEIEGRQSSQISGTYNFNATKSKVMIVGRRIDRKSMEIR
jgi:hypothetical protein